jgi:hypothetical protein
VGRCVAGASPVSNGRVIEALCHLLGTLPSASGPQKDLSGTHGASVTHSDRALQGCWTAVRAL